MAARRPAHADPHGLKLVPFLQKTIQEIHVDRRLWAGLRVAMWITHVGDKFRHGLLETSLKNPSCEHSSLIRRPTQRIEEGPSIKISEP